MKKPLCLISFIILSTLAWAQNVELKTVKQFKNDKSSIYIRKEVNPQDDITGNDIFFDADGNFMLYQRDTKLMLFTNQNLEIEKKIQINTDTSLQTIHTTENNILMGNHTEAFYFDKTGSEIFRVNVYLLLNKLKGSLGNWFDDCYYDKQNDILIIKEGQKLYSIISPTLNEVQNQKNFYNAEETKNLIESEKYVPHLTLDKRGRLCIDGIRYRWGDTIYETKNYIISLIHEDKYINVFDRTDSSQLNYSIPENEEVESITYHPNGDWYFLTINWSNNMHTIWRIENTWDSQWREQWYKEHSSANK